MRVQGSHPHGIQVGTGLGDLARQYNLSFDDIDRAYFRIIDALIVDGTAKEAPSRLEAQKKVSASWGFGAIAERDAQPDALVHFLERATQRKAGNETQSIAVGRKLIGLLVQTGDWSMLVRLLLAEKTPETVRHEAAKGIGQVMGRMHASGLEIPQMLFDAAHVYVSGDCDLLSGWNREMSEVALRFAEFYSRARLWGPLGTLVRIDVPGEVKGIALKGYLQALKGALGEGAEVPEKVFSDFPSHLSAGRSLFGEIRDVSIGYEYLNLCFRHNLSKHIFEIVQEKELPDELRSMAEMMLLELAEKSLSTGPDPADRVKRDLRARIDSRDAQHPRAGARDEQRPILLTKTKGPPPLPPGLIKKK